MDFNTIAARAVNASRTIHKPTYAGLRLLLAPLANCANLLLGFLDRRCGNREAWRYFSFLIIKDSGKSIEPTYRHCVVGSPLTLLAEAHVLGLMAREPAFAVPPCAFSYRWPEATSSGRNYEYFVEGYETRNQKASALLAEHAGNVALVTDIKAFYPSVSKDRLRTEVMARTRTIPDAHAARQIERFVRGLVELQSPKTIGLPVGPDLSHALGHLALAPIDKAMTEAFGDRYLRYVDDIIIVCRGEDVDPTIRQMAEALEKEGLLLNEAKQDLVTPATWHAECTSFVQRDEVEGFDALLEEITFYLMMYPGRAEHLQAAFRQEGFSLPIGRIRSQAQSRRYRAYLHGRYLGLGSIWFWFKRWFTSERSLREQAGTIRTTLLSEAERMSGQAPPPGPVRRRWYVQKRRYVLNRLLYLLSPSEYGRLLQLTPDIDEFHELRLVIEALTSGDATLLLKHPGRAVNTFCQLWPEHNEGVRVKLTWPATPDRANAESAAHLALYLSARPSDLFRHAVEARYPGSRLLLDLCGTGVTDRKKVEKLSFLDEIALLYGSTQHEEIVRLISTRFDELEEIGLEGLLLGGTSDLPSCDTFTYS